MLAMAMAAALRVQGPGMVLILHENHPPCLMAAPGRRWQRKMGRFLQRAIACCAV